MLCCVGLYGGIAVGQMMGGYWRVAAPPVGFAVGFAGDMLLMYGILGKAAKGSGDSNNSNHKGKKKMPCCIPIKKKNKQVE